MFTKHSAKALILSNLLLLAGCSGTGNLFPPSGDRPIKVESEPSGADVYVMGEKIGVTPMQIGHKDVFPNIYPKEKEAQYGRVTIRKEGCADFTRTISTEVSSNGLRARLDCGTAPPAMPATSSSPVTTDDVPRSSEGAEQRLEKIRDLLNKGLITEEDAKKARERIVNEL